MTATSAIRERDWAYLATHGHTQLERDAAAEILRLQGLLDQQQVVRVAEGGELIADDRIEVVS